jgi:hypothetical protein
MHCPRRHRESAVSITQIGRCAPTRAADDGPAQSMRGLCAAEEREGGRHACAVSRSHGDTPKPDFCEAAGAGRGPRGADLGGGLRVPGAGRQPSGLAVQRPSQGIGLRRRTAVVAAADAHLGRRPGRVDHPVPARQRGPFPSGLLSNSASSVREASSVPRPGCGGRPARLAEGNPPVDQQPQIGKPARTSSSATRAGRPAPRQDRADKA